MNEKLIRQLTLDLAADHRARKAAVVYAELVRTDNPQLAAHLLASVEAYGGAETGGGEGVGAKAR